MAEPLIHDVRVGDLSNPLGFKLQRPDGTGIDVTGKTVKLYAVDESGETVIEESADHITITDAAAADGAEGQYAYQAADVASVRRFFPYVTVWDGATLEETIPAPDSQLLIVNVDAHAGAGPTAGYTTRDAIRKRLTDVGYRWVADRRDSGGVTESEADAVIDPALEYADNLIDGSIAHMADTTATRALGLSWLRDRATDLAAYRAATMGGRRVPRVLKDDFDRAIELLTEVREGRLAVPGLVGTGPRRTRGGVVGISATEECDDPCRRYDPYCRRVLPRCPY